MNTADRRKKKKKHKAEAKTDKKKSELNPEEIYTDRCIAFLDILGFKDLVDKSVVDPAERLVLYKMLHHDHSAHYSSLFSSPLTTPDGIPSSPPSMRTTVFSDSIVSSFEAADNPSHILIAICDIFCGFCANNFFLRGGFSSGELFHEGNVLFGPAMNEAYRLENTAIYPRIVIDPKLVYNFNSTIRMRAPNEKRTIVYEYQFVRRDSADGAAILNVVEYALAMAYEEAAKEAHRLSLGEDCSDPNWKWWRKWPFVVKKYVEANLNRFPLDSSEFRKYHWFATHFNEVYFQNNPSTTIFSTPPSGERKPGDGSVQIRFIFGAPINIPNLEKPASPDPNSPNQVPD